MKQNLKTLKGYDVVTTGSIKANIKDFLFDENNLTIRYIEVDFGNIFSGKRVLIPITLFQASQLVGKEFYLNISNEELENCPKPEENKPISRRYEEELFKYLQLQYYWTSGGPLPRQVPQKEIDESNLGTSLRSYNEVKGYTIQTLEREFGKLDDFIAETNTWEIFYIIVDTSIWLPLSRKVILDIGVIENISYKKEVVKLNIHEDLLKQAPEYDSDAEFDQDTENQVRQFYSKLTAMNF